MVEGKASEPPHVLQLWLGVSTGMLPVKCFNSYIASFLYQSNFVEIIRLSQNLGESGHAYFLGCLNIKNNDICLFVYVFCNSMMQFIVRSCMISPNVFSNYQYYTNKEMVCI